MRSASASAFIVTHGLRAGGGAAEAELLPQITKLTGVLAGFNFSAEFRRNFGFFSFPLVTGIRNFDIFQYISFQNSTNFVQNPPKSAEIYRNFGTKFRFR